jgi:hypothetical protein
MKRITQFGSKISRDEMRLLKGGLVAAPAATCQARCTGGANVNFDDLEYGTCKKCTAEDDKGAVCTTADGKKIERPCLRLIA